MQHFFLEGFIYFKKSTVAFWGYKWVSAQLGKLTSRSINAP